VSLAALSLLCVVAQDEALLVIVDDAQWLDSESVAALDLVDRRSKTGCPAPTPDLMRLEKREDRKGN